MRRMKVLFNTYASAFQNPGGGEVIIQKLKKYLEKQDVEVTLFNPWRDKLTDFDLVHHFSTKDWHLFRWYKSNGLPLVVTPTIWPDVSIKSRITHTLKHWLKIIYARSLSPYSLRSALQKSDLILPTTGIEGKRLQQVYGSIDPEKIAVLSNGVDILEASVDERNSFVDKYGVDHYALFVGTVLPNKNVDKIIASCQKIGIPLFVIGAFSSDHKEYYEACTRLANEHTRFIGQLPQGSSLLNDALAAAKVLVVASDFETCSLAGLEAASFATPVSITERGGTKEVYGDLVEYLDPDNMDSISGAIKRSLEKNGQDHVLQEHVVKNYNWSVIASRLITHYQSLLQKKRDQ